MGTNSFHLIIAKVKKNGSFKIVDREREVIRLGSHEGQNLSIISPGEIEASVEVLLRFKKLSGIYGTNMNALATSAVREAENKNEFISLIKERTGIKVKVIEGHHEARLIYLGVKKALPISDKKVLCIDIGGGSTEFILGDNGEPAFAESVKIGAVRLSKKFFPDYVLTPKSVSECEKFIEQEIKSNRRIKLNTEIDFAVGSSGTIQSAASIICSVKYSKPPASLNGFTFSSDELKIIFNDMMRLKTPSERINIKGLEAKRADIIPAGMLVLKKIFDLFGIRKMTVSEFALREGILLEMISKSRVKE